MSVLHNTRPHRCWIYLLPLMVMLTTAPMQQAAQPQQFIIQDGQPNAQIIISDQATRMAKLAASELQEQLIKISGAKLPVVTQPSKDIPVHIYVGQSRYTDELGIKTDTLDHGAFRSVTGGNWLALIGNDDDFSLPEPWAHSKSDRPRVLADWDKITGRTWGNPMMSIFKGYSPALGVWEYDEHGSFNAVTSFLRGLGARWYAPGDMGEVLPKLPTIALPEIDQVTRPTFPVRQMQFYNRYHVASRDEAIWQLRLGLNNGQAVIGIGSIGHGIVDVHSRPETAEAHPEYFALWGKRAVDAGSNSGGKPCLSSPGLFEQNVQFARAYLDHYDVPMVSVMPADGYSIICQCDLCKGKQTSKRGYTGQLSDYVWDYVNRVAIELYKTHPDRKILCFAYGSYLLPPEKIKQLSPNIVVGLCQWRTLFGDKQYRNEIAQIRQQWLEKMSSDKLLIWEYYIHARPGREWESIPAIAPHAIAADLKSLANISLGDFTEVYRQHKEQGWTTLASNHLNLWLTARLYWDVDQDVDVMLEEYYNLYYGPAGSQMKAFVEYCEANWTKMRIQVEPITRMFELLAYARQAAGDTIYGERIALIENYVQPLAQVRDNLARGREVINPAQRAVARIAEGYVGNDNDVKIDGELSDPLWKDAPKYALVDLRTGGALKENSTIIKIAWAGDALYVAIRCYESDLDKLNSTSGKFDDPALWFGDTVDILIETPKHSYYQIALNPAGFVTDADRDDNKVNLTWNANAQVATHVDRRNQLWSAEVRIPIAGDMAKDVDPLNGVAGSRPTKDQPWYFNIGRQRVREGTETQLSAFSSTGKPTFHVPEKFGKLYITSDVQDR